MGKEKFDIKKFKKNHTVNKRELIIDMPGGGLEPVYYWLTDYLQSALRYNKKVKKNDEAIAATVASSFFSELGAKRTRMEQRAKEIMVDINAVIKSILNLVYDLKEFDRRLEIFDDIHSINKEKRESGELAIKSVWMDEVDVKRGIGSLNQLSSSGKLEFVTLRDAFLQAKNVKDVDGMDLNERVKRIVKARIGEYEKWRKRYEEDLRKRRKIELLYLKAQVRTLKEYTTWAKPYLIAAQKLRMNSKLAKESAVDLVEFFDSTTINVSMRACKQIKANSLFDQLGKSTKNEKLGRIREPADPVYAAIELDFIFGSKPTLVSRERGPAYRHIGTIIVTFNACVYTGSELEKLEEAEEEEGLEMVKALDEMTKGSLEAIADDLDKYLKEKGDKKKDFEFKPLGNIFEPFGDILSGFKEMFGPLLSFIPTKKDKKELKLSSHDKWIIKLLKEEAKKKAKKDVYSLFKIFRKSRGMITFRG